MNEFLGDRSIKKGVLAVLALLALFLLVQSINGFKENGFIGKGDSYQSTINVRGEGEISAVPDIATFNFSITEESKTVEDAQTALSEKISKVLNSLKEFGLDEKNIKTTNYNIYPRYEYYTRQQVCPVGFTCPPASGERVLIGYEASQGISLKIEEIEKSGEVLKILGDNGAENINGPRFDFSDREKLERDARKMAIDEARKDAEQLAKDLGVKLVRVVSYWETNNNFYGRGGEFDHAFVENASSKEFSPEIPVGEDKISSSIEITYEIK